MLNLFSLLLLAEGRSTFGLIFLLLSDTRVCVDDWFILGVLLDARRQLWLWLMEMINSMSLSTILTLQLVCASVS